MDNSLSRRSLARRLMKSPRWDGVADAFIALLGLSVMAVSALLFCIAVLQK